LALLDGEEKMKKKAELEIGKVVFMTSIFVVSLSLFFGSLINVGDNYGIQQNTTFASSLAKYREEYRFNESTTKGGVIDTFRDTDEAGSNVDQGFIASFADIKSMAVLSMSIIGDITGQLPSMFEFVPGYVWGILATMMLFGILLWGLSDFRGK